MTEGLLEALVDRMREERKHQMFLAGVIASQIVNMAGKQLEEGATLTTPADFFKELKGEEIDLTKLTPEQQATRMINMFQKKTYTHG
jgi:hypothetical protein